MTVLVVVDKFTNRFIGVFAFLDMAIDWCNNTGEPGKYSILDETINEPKPGWSESGPGL